MRKFHQPFWAAALAASLLAGCGKKAEAPSGLPPMAVAAATAVARDVPIYLNGDGMTTAFESVNIVSQVDGQIVALPFRQGSMVRKGDQLALIYQPPFVAAVEKAKGQVVTDQANLDLAKLQVERSRQLLADKYISQQQFDSYVAQVKVYEGQLQADQGLLDTAQINLGYSNITSPVEGMVGNYLLNVGNVIKANDKSITTVQGMNPIYADFVVPETEFPRVLKAYNDNGGNLKVLVSSLSKEANQVEGNLTILGNAVASNTGTVSLRATVPNGNLTFWPNQPIRARIQLETLKDAILVPEDAVMLSQQGNYVFVVVQPQKPGDLPTVEMRIVQTGITESDGLMVIISGVKAGEEVVVQGILLAPGMPIMLTRLDGKDLAPPTGAPGAAPEKK